ncbi:MAG TPA: AraC family transcriptional regulator, partial [Dongiaceae bacterium]|nr:AraC family transcriptional regulator [Dongiaceae bacterium]
MESAGAVPRTSVPVSLGSPRFRTVEVDGFRVTDAWFPPHLRLPPHAHDRASFAVMLEGSFDLALTGRTHACPPSTVFTEPIGERHGNRVDRAGARVLVVQPDPARLDIVRPCGAVLDRTGHFRDAGIARLAWRLVHELRSPDTIAPLAIEATVLAMLATAARLGGGRARSRRAPAWLPRVRDLLQARFLETPSTADLAREVGIHPVHLARVFRAHERTTIGAYVRGLRLDWAARRLTGSRD